ncbi:FAD-dependent monooxygenase [Nocardia sp. NEAU-G5]|uniref:FAD-dependent monooxygenase n=1 Tax=Nocardia albiluteola TaxID=2842303 RepID=A0ABS6AUE7_9NOCA|nr:FAD-dependent monooxygenase [Nocardia albiluteola]MBU3060580.1 FAD-dependent monooxygenase [Nocardia albiluteola]
MGGVVIEGAGPSGLMLACELGLAGNRPVVLDSLPGPNPQPRVNRIVGQAARILDHRGLYSTLTGTTDPPKPAPRTTFAGFPLDLTAVPGSQLFTIPVQQRGLVQVLAERAGEYDADIRWGHTVTGFDQHDDGVTVHVAGPDGAYALDSDYLVGADGGTSSTRHLAHIDFPGMSSYDLVIRMGFNVVPPDEWLPPIDGALHTGALPPLRFHRTEQGVFTCGAVGSRVAVMTYEMDTSAREQRGDEHIDEPPMSLAELEASARRVLGQDVPLRPISPNESLDLRRLSGINSRIASRYRDGRVLLVGDAAHVHSPIGGPGLNLGLQDAVNLGWKLAVVLDGRAEPTLLDTYQTERRAAAERVIMQSRAQLALLRPGPEATALHQLFAELITAPGNVAHLSDLLSGAENRYTISVGAHPLVGYWVPDFAVTDTGGAHRVAELARDGRPLLADLTGDGTAATAVTDIGDRLTVAAGRPVGAIPATALLMRPDGYVAWASSQPRPGPDELGELRTVLAQWFGI